jgi:cell division protein FtsI/penicillin-binding protein 2
VTAETIKNGKARYVAGDYAGLSGLQGQYNEVLGGTSGFTVTSSDKPNAPLVDKPAVDGKPITLTLDTKTQKAAEAALVGTGTVPSALVAVDVATGDLLAVASSPEAGMNRALLSAYAPGSTLKVATTYSLLTKGVSPTTPVLCPPRCPDRRHDLEELRARDLGAGAVLGGLCQLVQHRLRRALAEHAGLRRA